MKFEYALLKVSKGRDELIYEWGNKRFYDLLQALNELGEWGWELH